MTENTERNAKTWAIGAVVLAVVVAATAFLLTRGEEEERPRTAAPAPTPTDHHVPWDVTVVARPIKGKPTRGQRRAARDQEVALAAAVSRVHDAVILGVDEVSELEGEFVTPDATKAMTDSPLVHEADPSEIEADRRDTRIAVEADRARRAVAETTIRATITQSGQGTEVTYKTTMWLERAGKGWRVIAFEGDRKPS